MAKSKSKELKLFNVRLAFPELKEPSKFGTGNSPPKYAATFIISPDDPQVKMIKDAIIEVAKATWGDDAEDMLKAWEIKDDLPLHNGDAKPKWAGYPGNLYVKASSVQTSPPTLVDQVAKEVPRAQAYEIFYSGCYVNAVINIYSQIGVLTGFSNRINGGLRGVQFVKDGTPFAGVPPAPLSAFEVVEVDDEDAGLIG